MLQTNLLGKIAKIRDDFHDADSEDMYKSRVGEITCVYFIKEYKNKKCIKIVLLLEGGVLKVFDLDDFKIVENQPKK